MQITEVTRKFIRDHADDDLLELLLNASSYHAVDVKMAVIQIKARKQVMHKLPAWYKVDHLIFPSTLAVEQCSSEITALYKQRLVQNDDLLCDLTGGLGVDAYYFSKKVKHINFVEKNSVYCDAARTNFQVLGVTNIKIINNDAIEYLRNSQNHNDGINVYYIDPSRRDSNNRRYFAFSDCEPDIIKIYSILSARYRMIIKLSPMMDLTQLLTLIPFITEVHVISVKNECKELLVITDALYTRINNRQTLSGLVESSPNYSPDNGSKQQLKTNPTIYCINYSTEGNEHSFCFRLADERAIAMTVAKHVGHFLYEPNASILKAGAYKLVVGRFGVEKLHINSHLYTSDQPVISFPGRIFEITDVLPFNNRICKTIHSIIPQANIAVRNFPLTVNELRKRTRIIEGGDVYLFATTLPDNRNALIKCRKYLSKKPAVFP